MKNARDWAIELIQKFEGFRAAPYQCPGGYSTVGWGHKIQGSLDFPLTLEEANGWLRQDLAGIEKRLGKLIRRPLAPHQLGALFSFCFNVGVGAFQRSTLRQKVNRWEDDLATAEFHRWIFCRGQRLPGLVRRRAAEAALYGQAL